MSLKEIEERIFQCTGKSVFNEMKLRKLMIILAKNKFKKSYLEIIHYFDCSMSYITKATRDVEIYLENDCFFCEDFEIILKEFGFSRQYFFKINRKKYEFKKGKQERGQYKLDKKTYDNKAYDKKLVLASQLGFKNLAEALRVEGIREFENKYEIFVNSKMNYL